MVTMLRSYDDRVKYVQRRAGVDLVEALVQRVKDLSPDGKEYESYLDSLEAVELIGGKGIAFGVISRDDKVSIGELRDSQGSERTVVYINPSSGGIPSPEIEFLSMANPWPIDAIPGGMSDEDAVLVHRLVTSGEMNFVRQRVIDFVAKNKADFRRLGLQVSSDEEGVANLSSLPDYMWMALRSEFGINADSKPHWRPALRWVISNLSKILEKDDNIRFALQDPLFREHTFQKGSGLPTREKTKFDKDVGEFQKRILG